MRSLMVFLATVVPIAAQAAGGGVVKLDSPAKAEWVVIQADPVQTTLSVGGDVAAQWVLVDEGPQVDLRAAADGKTATFSALADGQYRVLVVAGKDIHRVKVVRASPNPMPPGPNPPDPGPGPQPPPVPPADPLVKKFQDAYGLDTRAPEAKKTDLLDLIELYKQAGVLADDKTVATADVLVSRVRDAAKALGLDGLADLRKAIGAELVAVFPESVPMDDAARKKARDVFARIKTNLALVKP